jgi:putative FmdB family regulatory protein
VPLYEYKCLKCGHRTEKIEPVNGPHLKKCPECGGKVELMISASAIQFKGSGWYVTDYAGKKSSPTDSGSSKEEKSSNDKKDSSSKDSSSKDSSTKDQSSKDSSSKESSSKETKEKKSEKSATKK